MVFSNTIFDCSLEALLNLKPVLFFHNLVIIIIHLILFETANVKPLDQLLNGIWWYNSHIHHAKNDQNIHAGPIRLWRRIMANNEVLYELGCLADYLNHHAHNLRISDA